MSTRCPNCNSSKVRSQGIGAVLRDSLALIVVGLAAIVGVTVGVMTGAPVALAVGGVTFIALIAALVWFTRKERPFICQECGATWRQSPFDSRVKTPETELPPSETLSPTPIVTTFQSEWPSCPHCGVENGPEDVFCHVCGYPLPLSPPPDQRTDRTYPSPDLPGGDDIAAQASPLWPIPEPPRAAPRLPDGHEPKSRPKVVKIALGVLVAGGLMGICGFGVGIGYRRLTNKPTLVPTAVTLSQTTPETPIQSTEIPADLETTDSPPTPWPTSSPTFTPSPTSTPLPTHTPAPTATPIPSSTPIPSPTACAIAVAPRFAAAWQTYADQLGCALNQAHTHEAASQNFERGFLLWRVSPDQVYVLYNDGRLGLYPMSVYPESLRQNPPGADPSIVPPAGRIQPVRGFGLVWRDNSEVRDGVGWALEHEARADWYYKFAAQDFVGGTIIHECRIGTRVLLHNGTWFQVDGGVSCD